MLCVSYIYSVPSNGQTLDAKYRYFSMDLFLITLLKGGDVVVRVGELVWITLETCFTLQNTRRKCLTCSIIEFAMEDVSRV